MNTQISCLNSFRPFHLLCKKLHINLLHEISVAKNFKLVRIMVKRAMDNNYNENLTHKKRKKIKSLNFERLSVE